MNSESLRQPTILYVDDQPSHLALFKRAFQGDYRIVTAASAEEGLKIIKDYDFFLVLADHNMPRMTGIDFLEKARDVAPKAVQAILSAYANDEIRKEAARRTRVAEYLTKPWKLDRMRQFIEEAYRQYGGEPVLHGEIVPVPEPAGLEISAKEISQFVEQWSEVVDARGAKRIFLKYVEPPLKEHLPLICRPVPEFLRQAQEEALRGNFETAEKILVSHLRRSPLPSC